MLFLDYYYIWAAASIVLSGGDPYQADALAQGMYAAGYPADKFAPLFPYPVWALAAFLPFGALPFTYSLIAWTATSVTTITLCAKKLIRLPDTYTLTPQLFAFSLVAFFPIWKLLLFGQSTFFVLGGAMLLATGVSQKRFVPAGIGVSLMLVKPHLVLIALLYCVISLERRSAVTLIASSTAALAVLLIPLFLASSSATQLFSSSMSIALSHSSRVPFDCSLASLLSLIAGHRTPISIGLLALGALAAARYAFRDGWSEQTFFIIILPISILASPFSWSHDFLLLAPAYVFVVNSANDRIGERATLLSLVGINGVMAGLVSIKAEMYLGILPILLLLPLLQKRQRTTNPLD